MWVALINWLIVAGLVILLWTDVQTIRYFSRQERIIGRNWVLHEYLRTAWAFTIVYTILTVVRLLILIFSPPIPLSDDPLRVWGGVVTGLAFIWLGFKPYRQRRLFERHEGHIEEKL